MQSFPKHFEYMQSFPKHFSSIYIGEIVQTNSIHLLNMAAFHFALVLLTLLSVKFSEASRLSLFASTKDAQVANSTKWAVLVAGSNGYSNYRHQVRH